MLLSPVIASLTANADPCMAGAGERWCAGVCAPQLPALQMGFDCPGDVGGIRKSGSGTWRSQGFAKHGKLLLAGSVSGYCRVRWFL